MRQFLLDLPQKYLQVENMEIIDDKIEKVKDLVSNEKYLVEKLEKFKNQFEIFMKQSIDSEIQNKMHGYQ